MTDVIGTNAKWPYYSTENVQKAARTPTTELGKDQFLQILVTQLRNQDPMQPMQDKEFISQMASFSSLEQMMNMSKAMNALQQSAGLSAGVIGMQATWFDDKLGEQAGIVNAMLWKDGVQYARIGNVEVDYSKIMSIAYPSMQSEVRPDE